jgi:hypothetical protein
MSKKCITLSALLTLGIAISANAQPERPADRALVAVPTDAVYFASVKVSKIWDHAAAKPLRDWVLAQKGGGFDAILG